MLSVYAADLIARHGYAKAIAILEQAYRLWTAIGEPGIAASYARMVAAAKSAQDAELVCTTNV
jgi:hypothetical protein